MNIKEAIREDIHKRRRVPAEFADISIESTSESLESVEPYGRLITEHTFNATLFVKITSQDHEPEQLIRIKEDAEKEIMNLIYSDIRHDLQKCAYDLYAEFGPKAMAQLDAVIKKYL